MVQRAMRTSTAIARAPASMGIQKSLKIEQHKAVIEIQANPWMYGWSFIRQYQGGRCSAQSSPENQNDRRAKD